MYALLGVNGAGKTTIISILTGLVNKTSGTVKVFDYDLDKQFSNVKKSCGVVPQEMNFNQFEKVYDIIVTQAGYFGITRQTAKEEGKRLLQKLKLWEKRNIPSRGLSGGMKRRLMIVRALVTRPRLLILDEPTAGVDVELRHTMWDFLKDLNKQGTTILLTTHYLEEVEQMCRHAAMIRDGQIFANDSVRNLVGQLEKETYVVHVENVFDLQKLTEFNAQRKDDNTFTIDLKKSTNVGDFMRHLCDVGMRVIDFRPQGNRMEKLFLKMLGTSDES